MKLTKAGETKDIESPKVIARLQREGWQQVQAEPVNKSKGGEK